MLADQFVKTVPMNEAHKILGFKEADKPTAEQIMERFDKYYESNKTKHGGSIYLQCKLYHAKETLMRKYDSKLNRSIHEIDDVEEKEEKKSAP